MTSQFALPLAEASLRGGVADAAIQIQFALLRDDGSGLPVYESGTSQIKIMTVFSEFALAISELVSKLGFEYMRLEPAGEAGGFRLFLDRPFGVLLKAGLEIIAITRGFEIVRFSNET
jgi:hypothetical protein